MADAQIIAFPMNCKIKEISVCVCSVCKPDSQVPRSLPQRIAPLFHYFQVGAYSRPQLSEHGQPPASLYQVLPMLPSPHRWLPPFGAVLRSVWLYVWLLVNRQPRRAFGPAADSPRCAHACTTRRHAPHEMGSESSVFDDFWLVQFFARVPNLSSKIINY